MVRAQLQPVILVEVAETDLDAAPWAAGPPPPGRGERVARVVGGQRSGWWVVAVLVAVLAVVGLVANVRERERAARLAALPGVLAPLDASLHEVWRASARGSGDLADLGGGILDFGRDATGGVGVTLLDAGTGAAIWSTPFPEVSAAGSLDCVTPGDPVRVVCRVLTGAAGVEIDGAPAELVVLAADTGQRVAAHPLLSANASIAAIGSDVVAAEVLPDGRAAVTRLDPVSGQIRWTFRSSTTLVAPSVGPAWLYPIVQHGVVIANGPVTWAFASDGTVLGEWHLQGGDWAVRGGWGLDVSVLPDGRFAVGESGGVGLSDASYGTVSATDARDGFAIPGPLLTPGVDDGSAAGILLTVPPGQGGVVAIDSSTGRRLWSAAASSWGSVLVLDGRVIIVATRDVRAVDARSGEELWRVPIPMGNHAEQVLTDGRLVVVPRYDPERFGVVLTAVDPADGRVQWTAPLPARTNRLAVVHGHLLVTTQSDLVALG